MLTYIYIGAKIVKISLYKCDFLIMEKVLIIVIVYIQKNYIFALQKN